MYTRDYTCVTPANKYARSSALLPQTGGGRALTAGLAFTLDRVKAGRVLLRLWEPGRFVFVGWPFGEGWRGSPRNVAAMSLIDWPSLEVMTAVQE